MTKFRQIAWRCIWPIGLAAAVVATPIPFALLAFAAWLVLTAKSRPLGTRAWSKAACRAMPIITMGAVLWLAIESPKTADIVLERRVALPKLRITVGELHEWMEGAEPLGFRLPVRTWMTLHDSDAARVVEFAARDLSLRQFVTTIEAQTPLRHRFMSCGNGYTIWKGEDCSFGLSFR